MQLAVIYLLVLAVVVIIPLSGHGLSLQYAGTLCNVIYSQRPHVGFSVQLEEVQR